MSSPEDLYQIADELRAVAALGLQFSDNEYHRERYARVMHASARLIAGIENRSADEICAQFRDNLLHISPLAGAEAVVVRDGKLLLIRRRDDGLWALPGGLVEIGETLAQAAEHELWEEANVRGRATQLLGIFDSRVWQMRTKAQLYGAVFRVESEDIPAPGSEALDARFFAENELPELSQGHHTRVPFVFKLLRGEVALPFFDQEN
jgi:ADP-ribose pyrophosphatase YjhB (NUDIX family)